MMKWFKQRKIPKESRVSGRHATLRAMLILILFSGTLAALFAQELKQQRLNHRLIADVKSVNTSATLQALQEGADPNSIDVTENDVRNIVYTIWRRVLRKPTSKPTNQTILLTLWQNMKNPECYGCWSTEKDVIVRALIKYGADVNIADEDGNTPLIHACIWEEETINFLVTHGADVNKQNKHGYSALIYSATRGSTKILTQLLDSGALPNLQDEKGRTALMWAIETNVDRADKVQVLIHHGANVLLKDKQGQTALTYAVRSHSNRMVKYIRAAYVSNQR